MKKLVTTALLGLAAAACAFSFTACGGNEETSYAVTADEWKSAIKYITDCTNSLNVDYGNSYDGDKSVCTFVADLENDAFSFTYPEDETEFVTVYGWKDSDGKYYNTTSDLEKYVGSKEEHDVGIKANMLAYAGGRYLDALFDKYNDFTYDETAGQYTAELDLAVTDYGSEQAYTDTYNVTIRFANAKIVKFEVVYSYFDEYEQKNYVIVDEFIFNETVALTVPDEIKNLPLSED